MKIKTRKYSGFGFGSVSDADRYRQCLFQENAITIYTC